MQKVFFEVNSLDKKCYEKFHLSEDILMENATQSIAKFIREKNKNKSNILIVAGSGNNGADGITLARILHFEYKVFLYLPIGVKSNMAKIQLNRAKALGVEIVNQIYEADIIVDCIFGSGLNRALNPELNSLIDELNLLKSYKIACDIPSGIDINGNILTTAFKADTTITMGALKIPLFSDMAKDFVGEIEVANLGVAKEIYESESDYFLLEKSDLKLPLREKKSTHKGNFGHLAVISGDKIGASVISGLSGFNFGVGLVTLISKNKIFIPFELMQSHTLSNTTSAIAIGMGLGESFSDEEIKTFLSLFLPTIIDADLFYKDFIVEFFQKDNLVLTPHPKEFISLLKLSKIANIDIDKLQSNRFKYALEFSKAYPNVVLLLKGANTIIAHKEKLYINNLGTQALAKGGSGDVLSGMIGALLAQGYNPLESAINGSLAHSLASVSFNKNNYSLTPMDLIKELKELKI